MEEHVDIFDEFGNSLGYAKPKSEAHKEGHWHKSVHVWIVNNKNQILLQKRAAKKKIGPNLWDISVAGHISAGGNSAETAVREIKEELGVEVLPSELTLLETVKKDAKYPPCYVEKEFNDIYLLKTSLYADEMTFDKEEVADIKYVDISDFVNMVKTSNKDLISHPEDFRVLLKLFAEKSKIVKAV